MTLNVQTAIAYTWESLGLVWLVGLAFTKRTLRSQPSGARIFHLMIAMLGFFLLGSQFFDSGWLGKRFLPADQRLQLIGLAITIAGCLFAVWARITLGSNWSGRATVKAAHELIVTGPYALARHPIYTGLLSAALGTGLAAGKIRCLVGFMLIILALLVKMS
jgi:protein-S-isoprenylcysteine O-methyltransferase Ste14